MRGADRGAQPVSKDMLHHDVITSQRLLPTDTSAGATSSGLAELITEDFQAGRLYYLSHEPGF